MSTPRRMRVAAIVVAVLDSNGGCASPRQVETVVTAAGFGEADVRTAFDMLGLVAVTDPGGRVMWARKR